jgi:hypothetical protein
LIKRRNVNWRTLYMRKTKWFRGRKAPRQRVVMMGLVASQLLVPWEVTRRQSFTCHQVSSWRDPWPRNLDGDSFSQCLTRFVGLRPVVMFFILKFDNSIVTSGYYLLHVPTLRTKLNPMEIHLGFLFIISCQSWQVGRNSCSKSSVLTPLTCQATPNYSLKPLSEQKFIQYSER